LAIIREKIAMTPAKAGQGTRNAAGQTGGVVDDTVSST
jgi:hypothetical protein